MTSHIQCDLPLIVAAVSTIAIGTSTGVAIAVCPATVASSTIASSIASAGSAGVAVAIAMAEGARRSIGAICVGSKLLRKLFLLGNGILNSLLLGRDVVLVLLLLSRTNSSYFFFSASMNSLRLASASLMAFSSASRTFWISSAVMPYGPYG